MKRKGCGNHVAQADIKGKSADAGLLLAEIDIGPKGNNLRLKNTKRCAQAKKTRK
jgi:hypothetical protein